MKGPQRISEHSVDISHHVFPWHRGQPVLARMQGTNDLFLLLFSTTERLREALHQMDIPYEAVKQVDDPVEFLQSLPLLYAGVRLRVIVNPRMTGKDTMRYTEVVRETIN